MAVTETLISFASLRKRSYCDERLKEFNASQCTYTLHAIFTTTTIINKNNNIINIIAVIINVIYVADDTHHKAGEIRRN